MKILLIILLSLIFVRGVSAQEIRVTGQWNYTIPTNNITEAGEDFTHRHTSSRNQVYLDIIYDNNWSVSVQKNNIDWTNQLRIFTRRTGDGIGSEPITGGQTYIRIRNLDSQFITGNKNRTSIPLQYQVRRVSVIYAAHTWVTEIMYTLTAI